MNVLPPFDPNRYRKTVLARLLRDGVDSSDPFEIYDLPLSSATALSDEQVDERVAQVWAFWQKSREHPKYGGLVTALLSGHAERAAALLDRSARHALAAGAGTHRRAVDAQRFLPLDAAIARLVERFGGVPESKIEGLRALAATAGIGPDEVYERLGRVTVLRSRSAPERLSAPPAAVLRQIRADLDEVGQLTEQAPPGSLHEFLGLPPDADADAVRRRVEALQARNRERRPDRLRAVLDDLLTVANRLLVEGDPDAYLDALVGQVAEVLRPRLAAAVLVEDTLLADDAAHLVGEARAAGLDAGRAQALVARLAAEAGQPMPAVAAPPAPGGERAPRPGSAAGGAGGGAAAWHAALTRARQALRAGRMVEARRALDDAVAVAGQTLPPMRAVADEIAGVEAEVASRWAAVVSALPSRRYVEALAALERLRTLAADSPGPNGESVPDLHADCRRRVEEADRAVAEARRAGTGGEQALLAVLDAVADHAGALEALTALGVEPAGAVRAERRGASVVVRWAPSPSTGQVRYKVTRLADRRVVGRTPGVEIEDGSAPPGAPGVYEVVAVRAGVGSAPARSDDPQRTPAAPDAAADGPAGAGAGAGTVVLSRPVVPVPAATPPTLQVEESRGRACFSHTPGLTVRRADGVPLEEVDDGLAVDPQPPPGRTEYRLLDGDRVVATVAFVALPAAGGLTVADDRLRFTWPDGCTEVLVEWEADGEPGGRKVTNTRYAIDDGVPLPPARPLTVAVRSCLRHDGALLPATGVPRSARLLLG